MAPKEDKRQLESTPSTRRMDNMIINKEFASVSKDDDVSLSEKSSISSYFRRSKTPKYEKPQVAEKEQRQVVASKWCMMIVLALVAAAGCTGTFLLLKDEEENEFEASFERFASEVIAVSTDNVETTFSSIEALSNSVTSYVKNSGQTWPNAVVPDWSSRASRTADLAAGARLVTMAPVVKQAERLAFEEYARGVVHEQIQQDLDFLGINMNATDVPGIVDRISWFNISSRQRLEELDVDGAQYVVNWQRYPFEVEKGRVFVMNNLLRVPTIRNAIIASNITQGPKPAFFEAILGVESQIVQPIFQDVFPEREASKREIVGFIWVVLDWGNFFTNLLPTGANGLTLVLESSCGFTATYEINGLNADFKGLVDAHDTKYDNMEITQPFFSFGKDRDDLPDDVCIDQLTLKLFPSDTLKATTTSNKPALYTGIVAAIFFSTVLVFLLYDLTVARRQRKVMDRVITQDRLVSNLFPAKFRDRLYNLGDRQGDGSEFQDGSVASSQAASHGLSGPSSSRPIADLFLETTVIFIDLAGFTAWSSTREPTQVFSLLESIYGAFDKLCHKHGVFKVETIGDCFVAVCGLPEPRKDHAVAAAKFSRDAMELMPRLTAKLEIALGPDTCDLNIRIGLNSGQVTAGVLRGERSRFQLFGDTVNVASRMESLSERGRIHISSATADILEEQGRKKWVRPRGEVIIPGKGRMNTFWLETKAESEIRYQETIRAHAAERLEQGKSSSAGFDDSSTKSDDSSDASLEDSEDFYGVDARKTASMSKNQRLVEWNVELLSGMLKRVVAAQRSPTNLNNIGKAEMKLSSELTSEQKTVLEEFKEIIILPKVSLDELKRRKDPSSILLPIHVVDELRSLISEICSWYNDDVPFHNFDHASHVTASVAKLLSRITTSDSTEQTSGPQDCAKWDIAGHSYGITSDPLTQFAVVFSAIIHDAGHYGVPNAQLVAEEDPLVARYKGKSVAEQHSVDTIWSILMKPKYAHLRASIYSTEDEMRRFRQLLVNVVMATDIADKELGALRKSRWNTAFDETADIDDANTDVTKSDLRRNRKATIVIEHLIQASDVSHTMQHWQVYRKWNEKFFVECYSAWKDGRAATDPSLNWYKGEIGFFDFYIIPLAKKLDSCGVFGVSSHEYLNYATANRDEWIIKGEGIVKEYLEKYNRFHSQ